MRNAHFGLKVLTCLALIAIQGSALAQTEPEVKAAIVANIVRFVTYPESVMAGKSEFTIGVVGQAKAVSTLEKAFVQRKFGEKPCKVKALKESSWHEAQVLFVSSQDIDLLPAVLASVKGLPILVITESPGVAARGAMVNLLMVDGRVAFEINLEAARGAKVEISSRLLRLAKKVIQ